MTNAFKLSTIYKIVSHRLCFFDWDTF